MPKRLLMISTDRSIFAEGSAVRLRQAEYARQWDEVDIIVFAGREYTEQSIAPNCFVYPTRSRFRLFYPFAAASLGRFITAGRGITHITCQDPSFTAMAGVALKKEFKLPLEIQIHGDIGSPHFARSLGNKLRNFMARKYLPQADAIRAVSERVKKYLTGTLGIDPAKIEVRPIAVNTEAVKNAPVMAGADLHKKYPRFHKIALMASRLEPEKDIALAIRAWPAVLSRMPGAGLVIVGSGSCERALRRLAAQLGLDQSVAFEPWADRPTLFSYYKTADAFLSTSLFEGYGLTLIEAHAAGCPVISTDAGIAPQIPGARICPVGDAACISSALISTFGE